MVQMNKDERVWVCFEMARVQTENAIQKLWPNRWPVRRVPTILDTQELQKIQAAWHKPRREWLYSLLTSLNKNKVNNGRYL